MRNIGANPSAKHFHIKIQTGVLLTEMRHVAGDRWKVETWGETEPGQREAIFFPFGRAAQLRKTLPKPRRNHDDLIASEATGLNLVSRKRRIAQQHHGRAGFNAKIKPLKV